MSIHSFFKIRSLMIAILIFLFPMHLSSQETISTDKEFVFLLHGLGRKKGSMRTIAAELQKTNRFHVISLQYPFKEGAIDYQVQNLRAQMALYLQDTSYKKYHVVGHSLGGIIGMILWSEIPLERRGRIITLGSPFEGSPWLQPGLIRAEILEPFYGSILTDLLNMPALLRKYSIDLENGTDKMQIAGNTCPWYLNTLGIFYGERQPHDCFVTTHSALAYAAEKKVLCDLTHEGLLSGHCSLNNITQWLENDDPRSDK